MTFDTVQDPSRAQYLPVPRVPGAASAAWPPVDLVESLHPAAADVVDQVEKVRRDTLDAIAALEAGRPGGDAWRAARQADRDAVLNQDGRKRAAAKHLAALMDGEASRYGAALAMASTISERLAGLRAKIATDTVIGAVDSRRADVDRLMSDAAFAAFTAASDGSKSAGWSALESFDALTVESRQLTGLRKWLTGETTGFDASPPAAVPTKVFRWQSDARTILNGGTPDRREPATRRRGPVDTSMPDLAGSVA